MQVLNGGQGLQVPPVNTLLIECVSSRVPVQPKAASDCRTRRTVCVSRDATWSPSERRSLPTVWPLTASDPQLYRIRRSPWNWPRPKKLPPPRLLSFFRSRKILLSRRFFLFAKRTIKKLRGHEAKEPQTTAAEGLSNTYRNSEFPDLKQMSQVCRSTSIV